MILLIFLIEDIIATTIISIFTVNSVSRIWIPFVAFISIYIELLILLVLYLFIISRFCKKDKIFDEKSKFYSITLLSVMQMLYQIAGARIKVTGLDKLPKDQKFMIVYNHTSIYDPMVISVYFKKYNMIHLSKPSNLEIPVAGRVLNRTCYIPVNRENNREGLKAIIRAAKYIKEDKYSVGVAPEGTRNKIDAKTLLPFREGCFNLALMSKCPIVICELYNFDKIHKRFPLHTHVEMNILRVLDYDEIKDLKTLEISKIVFDEMQNKINSRNN